MKVPGQITLYRLQIYYTMLHASFPLTCRLIAKKMHVRATTVRDIMRHMQRHGYLSSSGRIYNRQYSITSKGIEQYHLAMTFIGGLDANTTSRLTTYQSDIEPVSTRRSALKASESPRVDKLLERLRSHGMQGTGEAK